MLKNLYLKIKLIFIPVQENNYRPKFLENKILLSFSAVLFVLELSTIPFFLYFPRNVFFGAIIKTDLVQLLNRDRESLGLRPLRENPLLDRAALLKAEDIFKKDYFAHQSPDGLSPWHWFRRAGYNYKVAGENLAIGFLDSEEVNEAWLNSPSHRENLLNPEYKEVGIAVINGDFQGNKTTLVVQLFGTPQSFQKASSLSVGPAKTEARKEGTVHQGEKKSVQEEKIVSKENEEKGDKERASSVQFFSGINKSSGSVLGKDKEGKIAFNFTSFFGSNYYKIVRIIIYGSLALLILVLVINIFVRINIQHPDLILKALGFAAILALFVLVDKGEIIKILPHNLIIH